jgi:hypothetical protein
MEKYCVVTFYSTHLALKFERMLNQKEIEVKIIPVPREISASCGLAGRFLKENEDEVFLLCEENKIDYDYIYDFKNNKYIELKKSF